MTNRRGGGGKKKEDKSACMYVYYKKQKRKGNAEETSCNYKTVVSPQIRRRAESGASDAEGETDSHSCTRLCPRRVQAGRSVGLLECGHQGRMASYSEGE